MKTLYLAALALTISAAQVSVTVPTQAFLKAHVAHLAAAQHPNHQWQHCSSSVTYAWDFATNCYSELWNLSPGPSPQSVVTCNGVSSTYLMGKCQ